MTAPQLVLLLFAMWTLAVPLGAIAAYRWGRILRGLEPIHAFRADRVEGADWYRRAMRAHANCVENLPVLGAIVVAATAAGFEGRSLDGLAWTVLGARVVQSLVHVSFTETARTVSLRFAAYFVQFLSMLVMGLLVAGGIPA